MRNIKLRIIAIQFMGSVFILSSITKLISLQVFASEVVLYLDIYFGSWLREESMFIAGIVCLAEFLIGIGYMISSLRYYANIAAFFAMTFFVYLTGDNYFSPSLLGRIESCGCFGELIHFTPLASFVKSMILWGITISIIIHNTCLSRCQKNM